MATEGYVKFEYFSKGVPPYYGNNSFPELLDDESIVVKTPIIEMNYHQYFGLFKKFLMSVGFDEKNVIQGACHLAFNESNREEVMREVAEEYELVMSEDLPDIIADSKKQDEEWIKKTNNNWEQRYWALYNKFSRFASFTDKELESMVDDALAKKTMPQWGHSDMEALKYSDEELNAMCDKAASDEEKEKCREYNLREAEYYNMRALLDANSMLTKNRNSNFPGENTICDKDDPSEECKGHWDDFWNDKKSLEDTQNKSVMKVTTNDPMLAWNGLVPGSPEAREAGCICPVLDNEEMPDDKKWIDVECPIHGRKK